MVKITQLIFIFLFLFNSLANAQKQDTVFNQTDEQGRKQGYWKKVYPNGNTAYRVFFKDNKPIGEYRRYHQNGQLSAFLVYDKKGEHAPAKMYDNRGRLIAEGWYYKNKKDSAWKYYSYNKNLAYAEAEQKDLRVVNKPDLRFLVSEEFYDKGIKQGHWKEYFPSGQVSKETQWKNDKKHGVEREYFPNGKKKTQCIYKNGKRHGIYYVFYDNGRIDIQGYYENNYRHGTWTFYDKYGKKIKETIYYIGEAKNKDELEEQEMQELQEWQQNQDKLRDPEDYMNNPDAYMRGGY